VTLPCIVCGAELEPVGSPFPEYGNQPYGGTVFESSGQYGSTVWDPCLTSDDKLEITVCDQCMRMAAAAGVILHYRTEKYSEPVYKVTAWRGPDANPPA
jgi:hypothetical protein